MHRKMHAFSVAMIIFSMTCINITCNQWPRSERGGHLSLLYSGLAVVFSSGTATHRPGFPGMHGAAQKPQVLVVTGVDDLFFLFFICLDSCGTNSAGL